MQLFKLKIDPKPLFNRSITTSKKLKNDLIEIFKKFVSIKFHLN